MKIKSVGDGKVYLIAGGGKCYTDIAARFVSSERSVEEIIASPYNKKIVENIVNRGHLAATEFDYWVFGIEGYSRVCETQLVRKRIASYLIKSGRVELKGKRKYSLVVPNGLEDTVVETVIPRWTIGGLPVVDTISIKEILRMLEDWYNQNLEKGYKEEDLRYFKPQATEFKAIIGMDSHALLDWFKIRCCNNAQFEIRDLAKKMLKICKEHQPDLFANAGASCVSLGFCPENDNQCEKLKGKVCTLDKAREIVLQHTKP